MSNSDKPCPPVPIPHQLGERDVILAPRGWLVGRKGIPVGRDSAAVLHTQKVEQ
ncbi:hypothetical protein N4G70_36215 [Streptomyces sp. ASQP_92]|uniref:hypothetical protein n=1 Tax=Streptomyces sp. ASQP_92 TaxID=2979116 RepID=UPI0021C172CA|nr:hypothetical protein [Streptomyces sp. ASQP_92]MCT9094248.1 hypothetical protein [Streptomyces sp. ASQP_92]